MSFFSRIQKENLTAFILFVAGVIQIIAGALYGFYYGSHSDFDWQEWIYVFAALIYFALSFFARHLSLVSLSLFFLMVVFLGIHLEDRRHYVWADGRILEFVIVSLLLVSLWNETNLWEIRRGRPPLKIGEFIKLLPYSLGASISLLVLPFCLWQIHLDLNVLLVVSSSDLQSEKPFEETSGYIFTKGIWHALILALISVCVLSVCVLRLWSEGRKRRKLIQSQKM